VPLKPTLQAPHASSVVLEENGCHLPVLQVLHVHAPNVHVETCHMHHVLAQQALHALGIHLPVLHAPCVGPKEHCCPVLGMFLQVTHEMSRQDYLPDLSQLNQHLYLHHRLRSSKVRKNNSGL
jgi:hypothetical protein